VTVLRLEDRRAQRCSSQVATAQELRSVAQIHHGRVVDELSVDGADGKIGIGRPVRRAGSLTAQSRSTRGYHARTTVTGWTTLLLTEMELAGGS